MPTYDKNTSVLKHKKIEYFIDYGTPKMTFLFYFHPFLLDVGRRIEGDINGKLFFQPFSH